LDYLARFGLKYYDFVEWDKIKRDSSAALSFISNYLILKMLEIKGSIHIDFLNVEYYYSNFSSNRVFENFFLKFKRFFQV
jgi:hypothetical protein